MVRRASGELTQQCHSNVDGMKRKVAVFTGTRAEYGLLYWLMKDIQDNSKLELQLIASAMHLSPEFGETWRQIADDGFPISAKVEMLLSSNTDVGIVKSMGLGTIGFADALDRLRPDMLVVLGDRFEALAIAQAALIMQIPIVHLHGGEITEGAYDDSIRHAISKMASLHFVAAEPYRQRLIKMGEYPSTVFTVGALGLDHLARSPKLSLEDVSLSLRFSLRQPYFLVTYHPVTAAEEDPPAVFHALLKALDEFPQYQVLITYPNADNGGRSLIPMLENYANSNPTRAVAVESLGFKRYMTVMSHAAAVVGNSSSGIIEAPAVSVPTVNIGARQRGRLSGSSVIHSAVDVESIRNALELVLAPNFMGKNHDSPYGEGDASKTIVGILENITLASPKKFYDGCGA